MRKQEIIMFRFISKTSLVIAALGLTVLSGCASTSRTARRSTALESDPVSP